MPRRLRGQKGHPWYRSWNDTWYIKLAGRQVPLAKGKRNEAEAIRAFHTMLAVANITKMGGDSPLKVIFESYLQDLKLRCEPETLKQFVKSLRSFKESVPDLVVKDIRPSHIHDWLGEHPTWNDSTKRNAILTIQAALNWAVSAKSGHLIPVNPLKGMGVPAGHSRGVETLVSPEDHDRLLEVASDDLKDFLVALRNTGTRPGNVAKVSAQHFFPEQGVWLLPQHKTSKKTGEPLVVALPPVVVDLCKRLAMKYPEGPLFRTSSGRSWSPQRLASRIIYYRKKAGLDNLMAYGYRHTVATELLEQNVEDAEVAAVLGQRNTNMIHKHYSHLRSRTRRLRNTVTNKLLPTKLDKEVA